MTKALLHDLDRRTLDPEQFVDQRRQPCHRAALLPENRGDGARPRRAASVRVAAFTAEDQTDRHAFLNRMSRLRADTSVSNRVIDVDGAIAGTIASFRVIDALTKDSHRPQLRTSPDRHREGSLSM